MNGFCLLQYKYFHNAPDDFIHLPRCFLQSEQLELNQESVSDKVQGFVLNVAALSPLCCVTVAIRFPGSPKQPLESHHAITISLIAHLQNRKQIEMHKTSWEEIRKCVVFYMICQN